MPPGVLVQGRCWEALVLGPPECRLRSHSCSSPTGLHSLLLARAEVLSSDHLHLTGRRKVSKYRVAFTPTSAVHRLSSWWSHAAGREHWEYYSVWHIFRGINISNLPTGVLKVNRGREMGCHHSSQLWWYEGVWSLDGMKLWWYEGVFGPVTVMFINLGRMNLETRWGKWLRHFSNQNIWKKI